MKHKQNCTIFSVGSNGQWEFETAIFDNTNCNILSFDCTVPLSVKVPPRISNHVKMINLCLSSPPPDEGNYFLEIPRKKTGHPSSWHKRRWVRSRLSRDQFKNYKELMEISEMNVRPSLKVSSPLAPEQIAVEMHFQTQMPGLRWFGRYKTPIEILAFGNMMHRYGYYIASRDDNPVCRWCTEILWVRA